MVCPAAREPCMGDAARMLHYEHWVWRVSQGTWLFGQPGHTGKLKISAAGRSAKRDLSPRGVFSLQWGRS